MNGILALLVTSAIGVDFGWQPIEDGSLEYIVQVEPELLEIIKSGEPIINEIPDNVRGARRLRIIVGTGALPRVGHSLMPADANTASPAGDVFGGEPPAGNNFNALQPPIATPWDKPPAGDKLDTGSETPANQPFGAPNNPSAPLPQRPIPDPDPVETSPFPPTSSTPPAAPNGDQLAVQTAGYSQSNETVSASNESTNEQSEDSTTEKNTDTANEETGKDENKESQSTTSLATLPWVLFFASLVLNMYLAGLARIYYRRYRGLAERGRGERRMAA